MQQNVKSVITYLTNMFNENWHNHSLSSNPNTYQSTMY